MIFTFIGKDKSGSLDVRLSNRPAHLDFLNGLNEQGALKFGGPFLGEDGKPIGSLVAIEADNLAQAEEIFASDPYAKAGLFASTEILPWNWVFNAPEAK